MFKITTEQRFNKYFDRVTCIKEDQGKRKRVFVGFESGYTFDFSISKAPTYTTVNYYGIHKQEKPKKKDD